MPADMVRRAHRKRGTVLEKQGNYAEALAELERAMAIARSGVAGIAPLALPLIDADIALVHKRRGEYDLAIAACEEGLQAIQSDPNSYDDEKIEARLHSELGGIYGWRGDYARSREHFEHSLRLRTAVDDLRGMAESHNNLGYLWQLQNEYERALEHYRVAEELARKINLRHMIVFAAGNSAFALINLAQYAQAQTQCEAVLAIAQEMNAQLHVAQSHDMLGLIAYYQGDLERAFGSFEEALRLNRALGSMYPEGSNLIHIALALNAQGNYTAAADLAAQVLNRAEELSAPELKAESLNVLAEAALGCGDRSRALGYAIDAAELVESLNSRREAGITQRLFGQIAAASNQAFDASFERSIALLKAIDDQFELGRTFFSYGRSLLEHGNQDAADTYLKRARDTFMSIGANGELQRLSQFVERSF
jgi:tetratricopeptide (TPR) repeat protein